MNDQEQLNTFLSTQKYMTLDVTLEDGSQWAVPVRIKSWEGKIFEWDSHIETEHSNAIARRPEVAVSIFTPEGEDMSQFGFYAHATAEQSSEPNERGIARYRLTLNKSFINDASFIKREVELA